MTRYLSLHKLLALHERIAEQSGGGMGVRDIGLLESALAQPRQSFGGADLYPHAAMEIFLVLSTGTRSMRTSMSRNDPCWLWHPAR